MNNLIETEELVKINPSDFGLEHSTAKDIENQFRPMLDKMVELEDEFNKVIALDVEDPETSKIAKEVRLKYVKVRTGTAEIHKQQKEFYLNGGRFVDGWKNAQLFASHGKERILKEIEDHFEILEERRKEALHEERVELIRAFVDDTTAYNFRDMQDDVFEALLSAKEAAYKDRIAAEKKAHEERIAKEKAEAEERERIRKENELLKKQAEEREAKIRAEKEAAEKLERARQAKAEAERKIAEEKARKEREEYENKLRAERERAAKIEQELKAKKEAEEIAEAERQAKAEAERKIAEKKAKAPVKKQLSLWVESFTIPEIDLKNEKKEIIKQRFEQFKNWAQSEIEKF
ncbi:MAG: hypothetical protein NXI00_12225 [Cytophagales bacterium]|nr:hypothetical protein [Cytophagales bacterium]